jgi:phosphoribosylformylglycinamidine (FGAM) synthase-like enzyme
VRARALPVCGARRSHGDGQLTVADPHFGTKPVDMSMDVLLGKPPKMHRTVSRRAAYAPPMDVAGYDLKEIAYSVLRMPSVASKSFLITIGDRSVGGLTARDQFVGPWQVPVADVAVTTESFTGYRGEAFAMGERTPVALLSGPASGRMAIGEAITNLAAADVRSFDRIKLSANWMAAAGHKGEDAALFDTVKAVALDFCPSLGLSIPVGKDSLSMKTRWQEGEGDEARQKEVVSPLSLVITAFAPVEDVRKTLTPQLRVDPEVDTELLLLDLGQMKNRLGGSAYRPAAWSANMRRTPMSVQARALFCRPSTACVRKAICSPTTTVPTAACSRRCAKWRSRRRSVCRSISTRWPTIRCWSMSTRWPRSPMRCAAASTTASSRRCSPRNWVQ